MCQIIGKSIVTFIILLTASCYPAHPETYGYVLDLGSPNQIVSWDFQQHDAGAIKDACSALVSFMYKDDAKLVEQAQMSFARIHRRLEIGWPGFTGVSPYYLDSTHAPLNAKTIDRNREYVIGSNFMSLAIASSGEKHRVSNRRLFDTLRPVDGPAERQLEWEKAHAQWVRLEECMNKLESSAD